MRYWIIKAHQNRNDPFSRMLRPGVVGTWYAARLPDWRRGDRLFIWATAPESRVVGEAELTRPDVGVGADGRQHFRARYLTPLLPNPIHAGSLAAVRTFRGTSFLMPAVMGTVHPLSPEQGVRLHEIVVRANPTYASLPVTRPVGSRRLAGASRRPRMERFRPDRDRASGRKIRELITSLWPDPGIRRSCIGTLRKSLECAERMGERVWALTAFADKVRLDVGQVEALTLDSHHAHLLCAELPRSALASEWREAMEFRSRTGAWFPSRRPYYPAVAVPSGALNIPLERLSLVPAVIRAAHREYIRAAAAGRRASPHRRGQSPALVRLVRGQDRIVAPVRADGFERETNEGRRILVQHLRRERDSSFTRAFKRERQHENDGRLPCEVCGFEFEHAYQPLARPFAEVHHLESLSAAPAKGRMTRRSELAIVCPNCHWMLHSGSRPGIAELRRAVAAGRRRSREPRK
jgi:hypothetical protein